MLYGYDAGVLGGIQETDSFRNAIGVSLNKRQSCCTTRANSGSRTLKALS